MQRVARRLVLGYGRFLFLPALLIVTLGSFVAGGAALWLGAAVYLLASTVGDEIGGDTFLEESNFSSPFHDALLYLSAALASLLMLIYAWFLGSGDFLAVGSLAGAVTGADLFSARAATGPAGLVGATASVGFNLAATSGNVGHELMHRLNRGLAFTVGQWVLSLCAYSSYMFEHIYGHHRQVGLASDTATARRGISFWRYLVRSAALGHRNAAMREAARLRRRARPWFHPNNRVLRGHVMAALVVAGFWLAAGPIGLAGYLGAAAIAIITIEAFSYVGHYGLVRLPGEPVRPRHSWNSYRGVMTGLAFNMPRHSSHHMAADLPYWRLRREDFAPVLPYGVSVMALVATVPPLYFRAIAVPLEHWDRELASPGERALVARRDRSAERACA